jgi:hypothetical protein
MILFVVLIIQLNLVVRLSPREHQPSDNQPELDDEDLENGNTTIKFPRPITTENNGSAEKLIVTCLSSSCDAYRQHLHTLKTREATVCDPGNPKNGVPPSGCGRLIRLELDGPRG